MCGRFVSTSAPDAIASYFGADVDVENLGQNFNVAPTQDVYGVVTDPEGRSTVRAFHWGLVPSWAKDRKIASKMINARSETLASKPAYRKLFDQRRCLVPMDGFYEWKPGEPDGPLSAKGKPLKQPVFVHRADGRPLAVAGLWTRWRDPDDTEGRSLYSATVVTMPANELMSAVHDRMPVIVPPDRWAEWLDPANHDKASLATLFEPHDVEQLTMHPVSTDVNNVRNNDAHLVEPI
jgi:putative SOS response-associated peptidase YedK